MKRLFALLIVLASLARPAAAEIKLDEAAFGKSLGGWKKREGKAAEYALSGSDYRTYRPEITPTPEGGIFVSVRIDHVRGWLSSDDHAMLEITISPYGVISSAKSSIAIQGRSITSDVIQGTTAAGKELTGADRAVQIGADLVADLSAKLLREKIVEAGRVSFPSALRHNYNLIYQALRLDGAPVQPLLPVLPPAVAAKEAAGSKVEPPAVAPSPPTPSGVPAEPKPKESPPAEPPPPVAKPVPGNVPLEVNPFEPPTGAEIPAQ
jgi:hypothetical protein